MYLCAVNNILAEIMPRQERLQSATGIYHVMLRGINKQDIFEDDEDYSQFLNILHALVNRCDEQGHNLPPHCTFYAYCLMTNHVHLLVRERNEHIGESIKRIGIAYARYYNHKYERNGHLFQDRFRSESVNSIEYFMTLMRYIHQNPVIAGLTDEVRAYPWSSWHEYEGDSHLICICDTMPVIRRLERTNLYEFVTMAVDDKGILDVDYGMGGTITDEELKEKIVEISGIQQPTEVQKFEKKKRNAILKQLCEYGTNIRQISRVLRESVMELFIEQKVDHENRPHFSFELMGNSKLIVESGGKLIINGGTLSNVELVLKPGATLRIINNGILETRNGFEAPIGAIVDIQYGQIM